MVDILADAGSGFNVPFTSLDPVIDEMLAFLIVSSVEKEAKLELVDHSVGIFDEVVLPTVRSQLKEEALSLIGVTYTDMYDVIECIGGNALAETLSWAVKVLSGETLMDKPDSVNEFAKCMEWSIAYEEMADDLVASAVIYQITASINIMLTNLASVY